MWFVLFFYFLKKKINKYSGSSPRFFCSSSDPPLISYICCGFHYSCQKILVPSGTEPPSIIPVSEHSSFQHFIARLSFSYPSTTASICLPTPSTLSHLTRYPLTVREVTVSFSLKGYSASHGTRYESTKVTRLAAQSNQRGTYVQRRKKKKKKEEGSLSRLELLSSSSLSSKLKL